MFSSCFEKNELSRACFEALKWFEFMHVCMFIVFSKLVWNWGWIKHPWALVSQIELWTMLFYVFTSVSPEIIPRGSALMLLNLSLSLEVQSGISRFRTPARAEIETLERGIRASSSSLHCFTVRSSGGLGARAESRVSSSSGRRASIERRFHLSSTFTVRLNGIFDARACTFVSWPLKRGNLSSSWTLFFWKLLKLFSDHIFASSSHSRHS